MFERLRKALSKFFQRVREREREREPERPLDPGLMVRVPVRRGPPLGSAAIALEEPETDGE